jgi:O-antigen/teichoic acid export membrane protein
MPSESAGPGGGACAAQISGSTAPQAEAAREEGQQQPSSSEAASTLPVTRAALIRAFSWSSGATAFSYGLAFLRSIVLARLLFPEDFGLFGLAVSFLTTAQMLTEFSLSQKILVTPFTTEEEERLYIDTVWTAELVRRILVSALILLAAYPASILFREHRLIWILPIVAAVPTLGALQNPGLIHLRRMLAFRTLSIQTQAPAVIAFFATIVVAYFTKNYIALVASLLIETALGVVLSYRLCAHRPRLVFQREIFLDCFHYGKHLFLMGLLTWLTTQLDQFVIARYLGPAVLGVYILSQRLATLPLNVLSGAVNPVLLPTYGRLYGEDPSRLVALFRRTTVLAAVGLVTISGLMALLAVPLIAFLYGAKWSAAPPLLAVLAFAGMFRALSHTLSPLLLAANRPGLDAKLKIIDTAIFASGLFFAVPRYGAHGAAVVGVISYATAFFLRVYYTAESVSAGWATRWAITRPLCVAAVAFALAKGVVAPLLGLSVAAGGFVTGLILAVGYLEPQLRRDVRAALGALLPAAVRVPSLGRSR